MKQTKTKDRAAQWVAGMAVASAGTSSAAIVQINLIDNILASDGTTTFNGDLTGGGFAGGRDEQGGNFPVTSNSVGYLFQTSPNQARLGYQFFAIYSTFSSTAFFTLAGASYGNGASTFISIGGDLFVDPFTGSPASFTGIVPIFIQDSDINGGAVTNAILEVTASVIDPTSSFVQLNRIVFDNTDPNANLSGVSSGVQQTVFGTVQDGSFTPVPEPSGLALLALGAGGIAMRRQRKKAA